MNAQPVVRLRPLTQDDAQAIEVARGPETDPFNWGGYTDAGHLVNLVAAGRSLREDGGSLAVTDAEGNLLGDVSWRQVHTGPSPYSWCWAIGIALLPQQRGKGYGSVAQRMLAAYLFAQTTAQRIEADTDSTNIAEQRALEKAGFTREGVMRQAQWRDGRWHDMVLYARVRGDE